MGVALAVVVARITPVSSMKKARSPVLLMPLVTAGTDVAVNREIVVAFGAVKTIVKL